MAYLPDIPQPGDLLKDSQPELLANFQAISQLINVNHEDFGSAHEGMHKWVDFHEQVAPPPAGAGIIQMYTGIGIGGGNELFIQNNATPYEFTGSLVVAAGDGWTRLPSGILLKWGVANTVAGSGAVNFPVAPTIPVFTAVAQVLVTTLNASAADSNTFVRLRSFSNTAITVYSSQRTTTTAAAARMSYLAIGV